MKKILLALGTTTSIIAPVVGVVACGATKKEGTPQPIIVDKPKPVVVNKPQPPVDSTTGAGGVTQVPVVQSGTGTTGSGTSGAQTPSSQGAGSVTTGNQHPAIVVNPKPHVDVIQPKPPINTHKPKAFYASSSDFKMKIAGSQVFRLVIGGKVNFGTSTNVQKWEATPIGTLAIGSTQQFSQTIGLVGQTTTVTINAEVQQATTRDLVLQDETGTLVLRIGQSDNADRFDSNKEFLKNWIVRLMPQGDGADIYKVKDFLLKVGMENQDASPIAALVTT